LSRNSQCLDEPLVMILLIEQDMSLPDVTITPIQARHSASLPLCTSLESEFMPLVLVPAADSLADLVERRVRQSTYGRIRNLRVEEVHGRFVVRGQVPSHHTKQLALHGALELIGCEQFHSQITVG
jgi:hypothetical protein